MNTPWQVKCAIDTAKAVLPFQPHLRRLKDRTLGYKREPGKDTNTIRDGLVMIDWVGSLSGATVLEVGSGWQPMIPVLLSLAGASRVYLTDLHQLMRPDTFCAALEAIRENRLEIAARLGIAAAAVDHATRECPNMQDRLRELRLSYLAPCDTRNLTLPAGSVDIVMSRAVLEHIPPGIIAGIFEESRRILRPGGLMLHLVDHSDHWSHRDPSITPMNFLLYPDWEFRVTYLNAQNYQNRLRHSQYVAMLRAAGFALEREERTVDAACVEAVTRMRVAQQFRRFSPEDLATTESILLGRSQEAVMAEESVRSSLVRSNR